MTVQELIERIMTEHWDIAACPCLFCHEANKLGFRPREVHLPDAHNSILKERPRSVAFPAREGK